MTLLPLSSWILEDFFYNRPSDSKPPISYEILKEEDPRGIRIQFAVAGFRKEDLEVSFKGSVLEVSGDNSDRVDVNSKYRSKFSKTFSMSEYSDLENCSVKFFDGILEIFVPVLDKKKSYTKLEIL